ncbi:DUF1178 family protein [Asaia astilbis]|uniref:DUF1178 family protein n=1 Tax=Asaia astilbis TaxID=610244 RepID=UPI000471F7BF|nr:DUF1178 family protein [Asaia astilbis]
MICYQLRCSAGHPFEGWFPNSTSYDQQQDSGLVSCPQCGVTEVEKSLMAPALSTRAAQKTLPPDEQVRMALRAFRKVVETQCDDVGDRFAEEAMKRHDAQLEGERQSERGIYGTMSDSEKERLEDEGVDFTPVPWIDRSDS